jgi:putative transposase
VGNGGFAVAHASGCQALARHIGYIHFNPVKHRYASRVSNWPNSSFHRYVARGLLSPDWGGDIAEITGAFGE